MTIEELTKLVIGEGKQVWSNFPRAIYGAEYIGDVDPRTGVCRTEPRS